MDQGPSLMASHFIFDYWIPCELHYYLLVTQNQINQPKKSYHHKYFFLYSNNNILFFEDIKVNLSSKEKLDFDVHAK